MPSVKQIQNMARQNGVNNIGKMKKDELIRAVQTAEGNAPCFGRIPDCGQSDCLFRGDCLGNRMSL